MMVRTDGREVVTLYMECCQTQNVVRTNYHIWCIISIDPLRLRVLLSLAQLSIEAIGEAAPRAVEKLKAEYDEQDEQERDRDTGDALKRETLGELCSLRWARVARSKVQRERAQLGVRIGRGSSMGVTVRPCGQ